MAINRFFLWSCNPLNMKFDKNIQFCKQGKYLFCSFFSLISGSDDTNQQIFLMVLKPAQFENSTRILNFANKVRFSSEVDWNWVNPKWLRLPCVYWSSKHTLGFHTHFFPRRALWALIWASGFNARCGLQGVLRSSTLAASRLQPKLGCSRRQSPPGHQWRQLGTLESWNCGEIHSYKRL